jgi:hypothetical protein
MKTTWLMLFLFIGLFSATAAAQEAAQPSPYFFGFETWHDKWSDRLLRAANSVDNVFASERMYFERNDTYVLVDAIYARAPEDSLKGRLRANLRLPGTMDRLNLFVESRRQDFNSLSGFENSGLQEAPEETTEAGVRFNVFGRFRDYFSVTSRLGLQTEGFDLSKVDPFVEVRGRYTQPLSESWQASGSIAPRYYLSRLRQLRVGFDFDYSPFKEWLFRQVNQSFWEDERFSTTWLNGLQAFYTFKEGRVASTSLGVESNDIGGTKIDKYITSISYQQDVGWRWLTVQATNFWLFERQNNFRRRNEFNLLLRLRFGAL